MEKINWTERFDKRIAEAKAKIEAQKAAFAKVSPPVEAASLTSETIIEGKSVAHWAAQEGDIPGWALWAVRNWKARGSPTPANKVLDKITKLREDAESNVKFAALDKSKAALLSDPVKKKKLLAAADKKSARAAELFAEADKLAVEFKEGK